MTRYTFYNRDGSWPGFNQRVLQELIKGFADLMNRNLNHRAEVCVPLKNVTLKKKLVYYFEIQRKSNKATALTSICEQRKISNDREEGVDAQETIYKYLQYK